MLLYAHMYIFTFIFKCLQSKPTVSKAERVQAKFNEQVKNNFEPQPSTSGISKISSKNKNGSPLRPVRWERSNSESQVRNVEFNIKTMNIILLNNSSLLTEHVNHCRRRRQWITRALRQARQHRHAATTVAIIRRLPKSPLRVVPVVPVVPAVPVVSVHQLLVVRE
jgi:hypothetical protein